MARTVYHPFDRDLTFEVEDDKVNSWKDAGWRLTPIPKDRETDTAGDGE